MPAAPPDPSAAPVREALRIGAGLDAVTVSGLTGEERDEVLRSWSRCGVETVELTEDVDARRETEAARSWLQWHEDLVFLATSRAIGAGRGTHLMFHAACLAAPDTGAAIALAAASGTGKTTATRRLGPHYAYLTDETAIVDPADRSVTPYPKPLSVLEPGGSRPKTQRGPDELGLGPTRANAVLARIAVLDRVREAAAPVPARAEPMDVVTALQHLVPQTSSLSLLPRGLVALCSLLDALGGAQRLVYAEADDLRPVIDGLLAAAPQPVDPAWEPLDAAELAASEGAAEPGAVRRAAVADGILATDGRLVLLAGTTLTVLEGIGPAVWFALESPLTPERIVARLAEDGPVPADAAERVAEAVAALESAGLLVTTPQGAGPEADALRS
ncbi:hypothetical protein NWP10_00395 [Micrococcus sp. HG099]|uniref:hypothetical protein n=1 Tax=Micrococcus sp. HG099 TaxID=2969755 RepID=UPI00215B3792|nr:hypothetical protein [Micrococcus sp. HG099]MCR8674288.1 hypothetical protein [Micrococcus sp. HG099]